MSIAGIVLAAGFSRRLGRPKQMIELGGETLLERAVRVAGEADLGPVLVVVNPEIPLLRTVQKRACRLVMNAEADEGIASSIRAGVRAAMQEAGLEGVVLMTCDQIATTADHLRTLSTQPERVTGSGYAGRIGVPAYFPRTVFDQLLGLRGDTGARDLLRDAQVIEAESLTIDIDTEEDIRRAKWLFSEPSGAPEERRG